MNTLLNMTVLPISEPTGTPSPSPKTFLLPAKQPQDYTVSQVTRRQITCSPWAPFFRPFLIPALFSFLLPDLIVKRASRQKARAIIRLTSFTSPFSGTAITHFLMSNAWEGKNDFLYPIQSSDGFLWEAESSPCYHIMLEVEVPRKHFFFPYSFII